MSNCIKLARQLIMWGLVIFKAQGVNAQTTETVRPVSLRLGYNSGHFGQYGISTGCNLSLQKSGIPTVEEKILSRWFYIDLSTTVYAGLPGRIEMLVSGEIACRFHIQQGSFLQISAGPYYSQSVQNSGGPRINFRERTIFHNLEYSRSMGLTGSVGLGREFKIPCRLSFTGYATLHFRQQIKGTGKKPENVIEIGLFKRIN